ncbi:MAG TPA: DMT family transporter, partial [Streptosporangiaceae bacterium]
MSQSSRAVAAAVVTVVLWASAFVAIRSAGGVFAPGALALGRLLTASAALFVLWRVNGGGLPPRAAWPGIVLSGLLWFGVYMIALNWGERDVDAGTAAMLVNVGPILIALLGGWLLHEGFPRRLLAGMAVSFGGAVVIGVAASGGSRSSLTGVLLCLLAAVAYAFGVIAQKRALQHGSAVQVTAFGCFTGTVMCLPFSGQLVTELAHAPAGPVSCVVYLGVFPTMVGFAAWAYALARTTSGKMGATTYAVPGLVVLMSWLFLGQVPGWVTIAGGLLCLGGVAVSRSRTGARSRLKARSWQRVR